MLVIATHTRTTMVKEQICELRQGPKICLTNERLRPYSYIIYDMQLATCAVILAVSSTETVNYSLCRFLDSDMGSDAKLDMSRHMEQTLRQVESRQLHGA